MQQERNNTLPIGGKWFTWSKFPIRNNGGYKEMAQRYSSAKRKELSTWSSISNKNTLLGMKGKWWHFYMKDRQKNLSPEVLP